MMEHDPRAPWWWPDTRGGALIGLFVLTSAILWWSRPAHGQEPTEFFKAIAQAVVLTGFLAAIGFLFNASKGASEANARADKALEKMPTPHTEAVPVQEERQ